MSDKQGSTRAEKAMLQLPAEVAGKFNVLTDSAALGADLEKLDRFKSILNSVGDESLPDDDEPSDNGAAGYLSSLDAMLEDEGGAVQGAATEDPIVPDLADQNQVAQDPVDLEPVSQEPVAKGPVDVPPVSGEVSTEASEDSPAGDGLGDLFSEDLPDDDSSESFFGGSDFGAGKASEGQPPSPEGSSEVSDVVPGVSDEGDIFSEMGSEGVNSDAETDREAHDTPEADFLTGGVPETVIDVPTPSADEPEIISGDDGGLDSLFSEDGDVGENAGVETSPENSGFDDIFGEDSAPGVDSPIDAGIPDEEQSWIGDIGTAVSPPASAGEKDDPLSGEGGWSDPDDALPAAGKSDWDFAAGIDDDYREAEDSGIGDQAFGSKFARPKPASTGDEAGSGSDMSSGLPEPSPFQSMTIPGYEDIDDEPSAIDEFEDEGDPVLFGGEESYPAAEDRETASSRREVVGEDVDRESSTARVEDILNLDADEQSTNEISGDNDEGGLEVSRKKDVSKVGEPARKKGIMASLIPFGRSRRREDEEDDEIEIASELSPGDKITLEVDTDEQKVKETVEATPEGDVVAKRKVRKKRSSAPVIFVGAAAALIAGVFILDRTGVVDVPFIGDSAYPGQVITQAPAQTSPTFGAPAIGLIGDEDPASVVTQAVPETVPAPVDVAEAPAEEAPVVSIEISENVQDPPEEDPFANDVATVDDPFFSASDQAVNADPAIEDLFDAGTTVTVQQNGNPVQEENIVRIVDAIEDQRVQVEGALAQIDELTRALMERDEAMVQRDETISAAIDIAQRAESIALAQNEILVRMVETEETLKRSEEVIQQLSMRVSAVESNDTVLADVDRITNEMREQKRDIEALARSMMTNNAQLEQRKREIDAAAALAAQRPAPPPSMPVPSGSGTVYGTGGDVVLELPGANRPAPVVPTNAQKGDVVNGYGTIEEISPVEGGGRLIITENGSFVVQ